MLKDRHIAFFIDVDNVGLKSDNYTNVIEQLNAMGTILCGKIYGAGERKHKEIFADAELHGYRIERPMRTKRRGRKEFDPRIYVDVVDTVARTPAVDAVCIIAQPTDLVYLYSFLRGHGIKVIALDNADDASCAFIDEIVDLGILFELKLPFDIQQSQPAAAMAVEQPADSDGESLNRTDELLKEIERLKNSETETAETPAQPQVEQQQEEQPVERQTSGIAEEARLLLERIEQMRRESAPAKEESVAQPTEEIQPIVQEQPDLQEKTAAPQPQEEEAPRAPVTSSSDSDLIKRIEEIRRSNRGGDDDFIEEIRKLLDGLE